MRHDLGCSSKLDAVVKLVAVYISSRTIYFKKKKKKSSVAYEGLSHEEAANRGHHFDAALCAHACSGATHQQEQYRGVH
jgi:hypothetical protein